MNKTRVTMAAGAVSAALGAALHVGAYPIATTTEYGGLGVWRKVTNPAVLDSCQALGLSLLAFGLAITAMAIGRWLYLDAEAPAGLAEAPEAPNLGAGCVTAKGIHATGIAARQRR